MRGITVSGFSVRLAAILLGYECVIGSSTLWDGRKESVARYADLFFFQAEDGIRDLTVTGVQTCALPISSPTRADRAGWRRASPTRSPGRRPGSRLRPCRQKVATARAYGYRCCTASLPREARDRKSTRLNSSHSQISYAVFCLKKKKTMTT